MGEGVSEGGTVGVSVGEVVGETVAGSVGEGSGLMVQVGDGTGVGEINNPSPPQPVRTALEIQIRSNLFQSNIADFP